MFKMVAPVYSLILGDKSLGIFCQYILIKLLFFQQLKENNMEEDVDQLVLKGMKNPFIAIYKNFQQPIFCIEKQHKQRSRQFSNEQLNVLMASTNTYEQLKGLYAISKANRQLTNFFMPTLLRLAQSKDEQIIFSCYCFLGAYFQKVSNREKTFKLKFYSFLCQGLKVNSVFLNQLAVSLLLRSFSEQTWEKSIRFSFEDIYIYENCFNKKTLLLFSKFIFVYSLLSTDSYFLQTNITFFLELLPTITESQFIYDFFQTLMTFTQQLAEETLFKLNGQHAFKNFSAYNAQCQTQIFKFIYKLSLKRSKDADIFILKFINILEKNINIVNQDNQNIMHFVNTLSVITRNKNNCVIIFSHKNTLEFLITTNFMVKIDEVRSFCQIFANLLHHYPSVEVVDFFQREQVLQKIYRLVIDGFLREDQCYRVQALKIINIIMNFDIISSKGSNNASLIRKIKRIVQESTFQCYEQEKTVDLFFRAKNACESLSDRLEKNQSPIVYPFSNEVFDWIFKEQRPAVILFHFPLTKQLLCQAFLMASKVYKSETIHDVIFTDVATQKTAYSVASYINIDAQKSPIVLMCGEIKYVLSKDPHHLTHVDIVNFIKMARAGCEKEYYFDESVEEEEEDV